TEVATTGVGIHLDVGEVGGHLVARAPRKSLCRRLATSRLSTRALAPDDVGLVDVRAREVDREVGEEDRLEVCPVLVGQTEDDLATLRVLTDAVAVRVDADVGQRDRRL